MTVDVHPGSWDEAAEALAEEGAVVVAGGTGLQPWLTAGGGCPAALVHVGSIADAWAVEQSGGEVSLGAMVAVGDPVFAPWFGAEGAGWFATPAVRRRATVIGNATSRLGPRELGAILVATGARLQTLNLTGTSWRPAQEILRDGVSAGALAIRVRLWRPERIVFHRVSARSRLSRVELGVCAATGDGCGVAVAVAGQVAAVPAPADDLDDFVAVVRAQAVSMDDDPSSIATITTLAARTHRDLHRGDSR